MSRTMAWLLVIGVVTGALGPQCWWPDARCNSKPWCPRKKTFQGAHTFASVLSNPCDFVGLAKNKHCMMSGCYDRYIWDECDKESWNEWCEPNAATSLVLRSELCDDEFDERQMFHSPGCNRGTVAFCGISTACPLRCFDVKNHFQCNSGNIDSDAATAIQSSVDFSFCPLSIGRATTGCDGANLFQCNAGNVNHWDNLQGIIFGYNPW